MSVEAMAWAFQVPLRPCPKSVLVALANRADEDGYCWPGLADLEARTGWKQRSIQLALRELEVSKFISISPRFSSNGMQTSNLYRLEIPTPGCMEGASPVSPRVHQVQGGGASPAPPGVHQVRGGGAPPAPKSSIEQSIEQSVESPPSSPPVGGVVCVVDVTTAEFHEFWKAYPRKEGKKSAYKAWVKARDRPGIALVLEAIARAVQSRQWREGYIPHPATWLNHGRWDDEFIVPLPRAARTFSELMG